MNIKEYYTVMSKVYLNQIILFGVFLTICLFFLNQIGGYMIFKFIFCITLVLIFYFFTKYLYYSKKEVDTSGKTIKKEKMVTNGNQLLMMFLPAPSLMIRFFNSSGICEFQLSDEKLNPSKWIIPNNIKKRESQSYILKKRDGLKLMLIKLHKRSRQIGIITNEQKHKWLILKESNRKMLKFEIEDDLYIVEKSIHTVEIKKNDKKIASINKGWMPIKWQRNFSPNTPVLTFQDDLGWEDRYIIYALLVRLFINQHN